MFRSLLLDQISGLVLHKQPMLTNFERYEQYTIDCMVYLRGNEVDRRYISCPRGCLGNNELKNGVQGYVKTK